MKITFRCPFQRAYSSLFALFLAVILIPEDVRGQSAPSRRLSVSPATLSVKSVLEQIEAQSDYTFIYSKSYASVDKIITLDQTNTSVQELLRQISQKTALEFTPNGKQMVVREKAASPAPKTGRVSGKVSEKETGQPLEAVTVSAGENHTMTDSNGSFTIQAAAGDDLYLSYIGMRAVSIRIQDLSAPLNIELESIFEELSELVVTGYQTQKKADLTGAVSVVKVEDIRDVPLGNPMKAMQGRVPGMYVTGDGSPNGAMTVRIRGIGTMNNNDPLYVIDGIPTKRGLQELNPNDIESIQVLKDASSATIYGSRAANGVIIVTTRKGRKKYSRIDLDASSSLQYYNTRQEVLNTEERGRMYWQAAVNDKADPNANQIYQFDWNNDFDNPALNRVILPEFIDAARTMKPADTRWFDEIAQTSVIQSYNAAFSNGGERGNSMFSVSYYDNKGIVKGSNAQRVTARLNSDHNFFGEKLKIGENLSLTYTRNSLIPTGTVLLGALQQMPVVPVYTVDGGWGGPAPGMADRENPVRLIEDNRQNKSHFFRALGNVFADYVIIPGLTFRTSLGIDYMGTYQRILNKSFVSGFLSNPNNQVSTSQGYEGNWLWQNTLNYTLESGRHHFDFLAGQEYIRYISQSFSASRQGLALENINYAYLSAGSSNQTNEGSGSSYSLLSYFGKVNYVYGDRYLASVTLRRDGSSRFGQDHRYGIFPAFSVGWRLSEEAFIKAVPAVSDLKLRYGWGLTGNQEIANNAVYSLYSAVYGTYNNWVADRGTAYDLSGAGTGQLPSGFRLIQQGNNALKWEETVQSNFGIDFGLLNNRITGAVDYFIKKTSDILIRPPVLAVLGDGGEKYFNGASMQNSGIELFLSYSGYAGKDFSYNISGNLATFRNKVTYLPDDVVTAYGGNGLDKTILGRPLNSTFGYVADGLFTSQSDVDSHAEQPGKGIGRIRYKDLNGDKVINNLDQDFISDPYPDFTYGLNFSAEYRNFDFSLFLQGVQGIDVYVGNKVYTDFASIWPGSNWGSRVLEAWSAQNPGSSIPALTLANRNNESRTSTYFIENGSYLKLRNIQLGYNLKGLFTHTKIQAARVYLQASNLFTVMSKNYSSADPENPGNAFPIPVVGTLGLNFSF